MKKTETLLELVDNCPVVKKTKQDKNGEAKLLRVKELREMGFTKLADELEKDMVAVKLKKLADYRYIRISDEMISAFLKRKVKRYDREHKKKEEPLPEVVQALYNGPDFKASMAEYRQNLVRQMYEISGIPNVPDSPYRTPDRTRMVGDTLLAHYKQNGYPELISLDYRLEHYDYSERTRVYITGYIDPRTCQTLPVPPEIETFILEHEPMSEQRRRQIPSGGVGGGRLSQALSQADVMRSQILELSGIERTFHGSTSTLSERTCDYMSSEDGKIGQYAWKEEKLEDYKGIPPKEALEALKEHQERQVFDYFTIASVKGIKDPLLLGKINGVEDRFFITQWGSDVNLDDIL